MAWTLQKSGKGDRIGAIFSEEAVDSSNKVLSFPSDVAGLEAGYLELCGIRIEYTATATVGTRVPAIQILDASNDVILSITLTRTVTANNSQIYNAAPWIDVTVADHETLPSGMIIPQGAKLKVFDSAAVDPAADDMVVHVTGLLHNVV